MPTLPTLADVRRAFAGARYETARRLALTLLRETTPGVDLPGTVFALHDTLVLLADFQGARRLLEDHADTLHAHAFETTLRLAGDFQKLTNEGHYRTAEENRQGYSLDEYQAKYRDLAEQALARAKALAHADAEKAHLDAHIERGGGHERAPFSRQSVFASAPPPEVADGSGGTITGRILLEDGSPAPAGLEVTLGLPTRVRQADPATFISHAMHYAPEIAPLSKLVTATGADGRFTFASAPADVHDFIAVTLPPEAPGIATRFLARAVAVRSGETTDTGDLRVTTWRSAPARVIPSPHPPAVTGGAVTWTKCAEWTLSNPFYYEFPRQLLRLPLPPGAGSWRIVIDPDRVEPHQIVDGDIALFTDLPPKTDKVIALYRTDAQVAPSLPPSPVQLETLADGVWQLNTGVASFRVAGDGGPADTPPLLAVRGPDGEWRGQGRFQLPDGVRVTTRRAAVIETGPLLVTVEHAYNFSDGVNWSLRLTALAGEPLLLAHERSDATNPDVAAFEFSLREFSGGRGYVQTGPEAGSLHWSTLRAENVCVGRLPEHIPSWIPPQGFGFAMTADGLEQQDYIGVCSIRRGDWIDRAFERIAQGPMDEDGTENRELDWPFPEMVGSSISMINVHTSADGDAFYRYNFFEGERQWAMLVSSFEMNDGAFKQLGRYQHAYSAPRLQEFKDWHFDVADTMPRPHVVVAHGDLPHVREKTRLPRFAGLWEKLRSQPQLPGSRDGLVFAVEGDPLAAWYKRIQLLAIADVRSKMTLLGRDFSDTYSPVGGRDITSWAEEYDMVAASGVFTDDEERTVRSFLLLMGHLYMERDFMNWKFNGRNANFEADRADIVAAVGLVFQGHPDSGKFIDHVIERTKKALVTYCTPGSGKWYENPACYYLHASKCRMNLVYHLAHKGLLDLEEVPRLKDFLRWALHLLTPPLPVDYWVMHNGDEAAYVAADKVRKVPPIGDHAGIGRWIPEHYAFIGKLFLRTDAKFGRELIDHYFCGNADGQRLLGNIPWEGQGPESYPYAPHFGSYFGNLPLFFCALEEADLPVHPTVAPVSRRLEGFGAILRNEVNTDRESCLLIKQGPGGYRYHRTEGSFLWFADGRPLVFDGGEAGETWRHSTLSFHDVHVPLSAGHVERYFDRAGFQFVEGVHPVILQPGEPVFLSDHCRHELVPEAYRRFRLDPPAVVRSFAWVDGDYLIIHDDLSASCPELSHWHLQVVGGAPVESGGNRFRFPGRFGIDVEAVLPGQTFSATKTEPVPVAYYVGKPEEWFTMQHLQCSRERATHYLAALRPVRLGSGAFEVAALDDAAGPLGIRVERGEGVDLLWFRRAGVAWDDGRGTAFSGSFGALLRRAENTRLLLMGAGKLTTPDASLSSDGPRAVLTAGRDGVSLEAEGEGRVTVESGGRTHEWQVVLSTPLAARVA